MKVALACQSVLLEKSLEIFLRNDIYPYKQCDFVISDRHIEIDKPLFFVSTDSSDLNIPFSKSALLLSLEKFYDSIFITNKEEKVEICKKVNFLELEEKITQLTDNFRNELVSTIKEYYEE